MLRKDVSFKPWLAFFLSFVPPLMPLVLPITPRVSACLQCCNDGKNKFPHYKGNPGERKCKRLGEETFYFERVVKLSAINLEWVSHAVDKCAFSQHGAIAWLPLSTAPLSSPGFFSIPLLPAPLLLVKPWLQ